MHKPQLYLIVLLASLAIAPGWATAQQVPRQTAGADHLHLVRESTASGDVSRGYYEVFEDRSAHSGRKIRLNIVVLHAQHENPQPDPVFVMAGGPGQAAARLSSNGFENHWIREQRDIVLVSQRGTDLDNELSFERAEPADSLQQYLEPFLDEERVRRNLDRLSEMADLRKYSTPIAMDDLNEVRQALGYDQINLMGASYGTRASLVYIRRHESSVRSAILDGCAPIEFRNPLYHAEGAQVTLDKIFDEVESSGTYRQAFPNLRNKFAEILARFDESGPVELEVTIQGTGQSETVLLNRENFVDALRYQMYYLPTSRRVPLLIENAWRGNFRPFAVAVIRQKMALGESIALGMLLSVTSAEDVSRIDPREVDALTANSFLGNGRVLRQMAAAEIWPHSELPVDYGQPVASEVPVLIFSGTHDPVTPPKWGQLVADNFPNSLHVIAPAAHGVHGSCADSLRRKFLETGSVSELDTSCIETMRLPVLEMPDE